MTLDERCEQLLSVLDSCDRKQDAAALLIHELIRERRELKAEVERLKMLNYKPIGDPSEGIVDSAKDW